MRLYLANDTSTEAHAGCKAVMRSLRAALSQVPNLTITATHQVGSMDLDEAAFDAADAVLINGEGSIHHSTARATFLLALLQEARQRGKKVLLVNALFQQYDGPPDLLANLTLLTVREPRSAAFARRFGGTPHVLLDSAADPAFLAAGKPIAGKQGRLIGGSHGNALLKSPFEWLAGKPLTMAQGRFEDIVATLRQADLYLTGQHHGVYAAALAGCPFVATPSNSHKIEAFIYWSGLPVPICTRRDEIDAAIGFALRNRSLYAELQDFMRGQSVLTGAMLAQALS